MATATYPANGTTPASEVINGVIKRLSAAHHRVWELETHTSRTHDICNAITAEIEVLRKLRDGE